MTVKTKLKTLSLTASSSFIRICFKNLLKTKILLLKKENQIFSVKLRTKMKLNKINCGPLRIYWT